MLNETELSLCATFKKAPISGATWGDNNELHKREEY